MNITRAVVTDLLPVYFSGEASGDTKVLVEDYFRQDPDFERIARSAATPLETLRAPAPIAAGSEKEKRDLESVRWGLRRRQWLFAGCLLLTLLPLSYYLTFTHGHLVSLTVRVPHWDAAYEWSLAVLFWFLYFARLPRRTVALVVAISLTLIPIPFVLHSVFAGGSVVGFAIQWIVAAIAWIKYFRWRPC
jgi:hypothetical protein